MTEEINPAAYPHTARKEAEACAACQNTPKHLPKNGKLHIGVDGKPMSVWQIGLLRLCVVMLVWSVLELAFGIVFWVLSALMPNMQLFGIAVGSISASVVSTAMVGGVLNLVIGLLGLRGAKNPCKITLFFWITLADAVLTAWAMASNIASGIFDVAGMVSGLFIISLAVCTWQVRGQTGYFDEHP